MTPLIRLTLVPMIVLAILLVTSTVRGADLKQNPTNPLDAPTVTPLPDNLGIALQLQDGSVLLPEALANEVYERLVLLEDYQRVCQVFIEENRRVERTKASGQTAEARATCAADMSRAAADQAAAREELWKWEDVAILSAAAAAVGVAAGLIFGVVYE